MAPEGKFHILVFPDNNILSINRESHVAREVSADEYNQCEAIGNGSRYCPSLSVQMKETQNTCLTGLYGNEMGLMVETCPVLHLSLIHI